MIFLVEHMRLNQSVNNHRRAGPNIPCSHGLFDRARHLGPGPQELRSFSIVIRLTLLFLHASQMQMFTLA